MKELSIFVDESGGQDGHSKYYVLTLVFHDQDDAIVDEIAKYRRGIAESSREDIPFHASPLMNGHDAYENLDFKTRKLYFSRFFLLLQHLPIRYAAFVYRRSELGDKDAFVAKMRQDVISLLLDRLEFFQLFDKVKIYYDDGQEMVAKALRGAVERVLSKNGYLYRKTKAADYILEQAADMLCALELAACKFRNKEATRTDEKMFGGSRAFKNNYMKAIKRKRLI